jgi:hypothetical protein
MGKNQMLVQILFPLWGAHITFLHMEMKHFTKCPSLFREKCSLESSCSASTVLYHLLPDLPNPEISISYFIFSAGRKNGGAAHFREDVNGEFHDEWRLIVGLLSGLNVTPCGEPAPGQPIGCPGSGCPQGVIAFFSYY